MGYYYRPMNSLKRSYFFMICPVGSKIPVSVTDIYNPMTTSYIMSLSAL